MCTNLAIGSGARSTVSDMARSPPLLISIRLPAWSMDVRWPVTQNGMSTTVGVPIRGDDYLIGFPWSPRIPVQKFGAK